MPWEPPKTPLQLRPVGTESASASAFVKTTQVVTKVTGGKGNVRETTHKHTLASHILAIWLAQMDRYNPSIDLPRSIRHLGLSQILHSEHARTKF